MAEAATRLLASLDDGQRSKASFSMNDAERHNWHFVPRERKGLPLKDLRSEQLQLMHGLLASALSQKGYLDAVTILSLEPILKELEGPSGRMVRDNMLYYLSIFGQPGPHDTWGWRFEGHHLSLNFTLVDGHHVSATPSFFGSNPAEVRSGPRKGLRALASYEDLGRALITSLDEKQRKIAIIDASAPADVITGEQPRVKPLAEAGLPFSKLNAQQRSVLMELIEAYLRRCRADVAEAELAAIRTAGLHQIRFAWAGSLAPGEGHYYRVQGPTFLLEYDNTQNNANHVHAVWRDFENDFGADLLRDHYRKEHGK